MNASQVGAALRALWWLPVIGLVVGGGTAAAVTALQTPQYESSTTFLVTGPSDAGSPLQAAQLAEQRLPSYLRFLESVDFARRLAEDLGLEVSPQVLQRSISAAAPDDTLLIDVTVTDSSPERAQLVAEAVGEHFPQLVAELEGGVGGGSDGSTVEVAVTESANRPTAPVSPDPVRNVGLGMLAGLLVGLGLTSTRAVLDRTATVEDVTGLLGAPVLGRIPRDGPGGTPVLERGATGPSAEAFRRLRNNLQSLDGEQPARTLLVTSVGREDTDPATVANLALALADAGHRVALACADLRDPQLPELLGLAGKAGLSEVLTGRSQIARALRRYEDRELWVVPAGRPPSDPGDLIASRAGRELLDKLRGDFDYVLVAAPPLLSVADASGLAGHVDGVLLTVELGRTRPQELQEAAEELALARARLLGVVLTGVPARAARGGSGPRRLGTRGRAPAPGPAPARRRAAAGGSAPA